MTNPIRKTVAIVVAHADDMEFMAAGTVRRFIAEKGYDVYEYILTDNAKGSFRLPEQEVIAISEAEAIAAGQILGLKEVRFGHYPDGFLNEENPNVLRAKIMAFLREIKANILMSWDPFAPYEEHPDHRVAAMAALEAASFCGMPLFHSDPEQPPHVVSEAYWFAKVPQQAGLFVDIAGVFDIKVAALLQHACQMELTVDALAQEAAALGVSLPGLAQLTPEARSQMITKAIWDYCASTGAQQGLALAEQFRYQKIGMLDKVLGANYVQPDFAG